jgi:hypothetical protein
VWHLYAVTAQYAEGRLTLSEENNALVAVFAPNDWMYAICGHEKEKKDNTNPNDRT